MPPSIGRRELRHRGERDQADRDQRVGLAGERGNRGSRAAGSARSRRAGCRAAARTGRCARSAAAGRRRSSSGITRSLQTIVDSAMVSTITMPVAADSPPMNTNSASACWRCGHRQRQHEGVGIDRAAGEMQQAAERDRQHEDVDRAADRAGSSQIARARCRSSTFSTTAIWNWRGRNMIASIDSSVSDAQLP